MKKKEFPQREELTRQAFQNMKRILLSYGGRINEELRPLRVTIAQLRVLFAIRENPQSSGAQLARLCFITPQTVQTLLRHLEEQGFIVRGKDPVNDRIVVASLTERGEQLASEVDKSARPLQREVWAGISDAELAQFNELLERCLTNLEAVKATE